jgi:hypothetical protein
MLFGPRGQLKRHRGQYRGAIDMLDTPSPHAPTRRHTGLAPSGRRAEEARRGTHRWHRHCHVKDIHREDHPDQRTWSLNEARRLHDITRHLLDNQLAEEAPG